MNSKTIGYSMVLAAGLALLAPAHVQSQVLIVPVPQSPSPPAGVPGLTRDVNNQGIAYITGGVGVDERDTMERMAQDYNLKLSFAENVGVYLARVNVVIEDRSGKERLNVTTTGPWLYAQLPAGVYNVRATFNGETKRLNNVRIADDALAARTMRWNIKDEDFSTYVRLQGKLRDTDANIR